jgi:transcription elongation factor SPT5
LPNVIFYWQSRKKRARRNQFLDIEAGEADEGDEDEDEEGDDDGWGEVTDELSEADLPRPEDYIRRVAPRPKLGEPEAEAEEEIDAEAEEERLRRLYGRRSETAPSSGEGIPRTAMLMPKATDPKLWLVKCRPGRERDAVASVLRGLLELDRKGEEVPQVFSAVCRDTLKGYIYLEAFKPADIMAAIKRLHLNHVVFASQFSKPSLVPMAEMADVLAPSKLAGPQPLEK